MSCSSRNITILPDSPNTNGHCQEKEGVSDCSVGSAKKTRCSVLSSWLRLVLPKGKATSSHWSRHRSVIFGFKWKLGNRTNHVRIWIIIFFCYHLLCTFFPFTWTAQDFVIGRELFLVPKSRRRFDIAFALVLFGCIWINRFSLALESSRTVSGIN